MAFSKGACNSLGLIDSPHSIVLSFKDVIVLLVLLLRIVDEVVLIDADNLVKPFFDMSFFTSFLGH